ncbi:MAG TPA: LodA/GoxA family CTQ-dependent oxidase [Pyrinomonadaceae bacterium]|nr:LodA/GoxA family CTQ-dependent oxidase [Pyrinomonadaceae bacterium]
MTTNNEAAPAYRIHPAIGVARLGDSPAEFCISPEKPAALPIECDAQGNPRLSPDGTTELTVKKFKDAQGRIKRQAARFHLYAYDDQSPAGRPLKVGDPIKGGGNHGVLVDIQWQVYLANKKSVWYEFDALAGEHGYGANHKRRNADITDPEARQQLIIDPGPRVVNATTRRSASFGRDSTDIYAPTFPPALAPNSIETLGEIKTDSLGRLLVLGGHGNSGTALSGLGQPRIDHYANNDGWFDDTSDGVVMARLVMFSSEVGRLRFIDVEYPAWVIVGYPAYVPEILDIVTLDDVVYDLSVREFAYRTDIYGETGTFSSPQRVDPTDTAALQHWKTGRLEWNPAYKPWFYRDIWPILFRADEMTHLTNVLEQSNYPHNQTERGNFDPNKLSVPPFVNETAWTKARLEAARANQSGALFIDALEPTLALLDEWLRTKSDDGLERGFVRAMHKQDIRRALRDAINQFADAVYPEGREERDADLYLKNWKDLYERAQEAPETDDFKKKYMEAKAALQDRIDQIEESLLEEVAQEPGVEEHLVARALDRRLPAEAATEQDTPRPVEDSFERYVKEFRTGKLLEDSFESARQEFTYDFYRIYRMYLYHLLRQPGEENAFRLGGRPNNRMFNLPLMPLLAGDNPLTNHVPSKFLRLTDYQHYILRQWAEGKFYNEQREGWLKDPPTFDPYENWENKTGRDLDQGVLMNLLGGAFCPGGEVGWIIRNPSIYKEPFRLKADPSVYNFRQTAAQANAGSVSPDDYVSSVEDALSQDSDYETGLQPGDLTKQMALPWQSDFNECSTQDINVTYEQWNNIDPDKQHDPWMKLEEQVWETLWWPAHRPLQTFEVVGMSGGQPVLRYLNWSRGVPQTNAGDLKMVMEWRKLSFVVRNPYMSEQALDSPSPDRKYISVERTED